MCPPSSVFRELSTRYALIFGILFTSRTMSDPSSTVVSFWEVKNAVFGLLSRI